MKQVIALDKVFPDELMERVSKVIDATPWRYGWPSNKEMGYSHWNYDFSHGSVCNGLDTADALEGPIAEAWNHIKQHIVGNAVLLRCYTNSHTYGIEGYPHTDSIRSQDKTILVYMNPEWRREWGGETVVYDGNKIVHAELPGFNKGLIFNGADVHCARSVTRICPKQRITLMFKYAPPNVDIQRDKIQVLLMALNADKIKHSGRTLMVHLLNTYDILKANGHDPITCAAGGLHSIFGTNIFTQQTLKEDQRHIVVRVIGEEATQLVELFRDIKRPGTLEEVLANKNMPIALNAGGTKTLTEDQINKLCAIEAANLKDQDSLKKYPHLSRVLKNRK